MSRTMNPEKAKQLRPKARTVVFTTLWLVLFAAAMVFIALAGHV
jgi:hypothetical protein